MEKRSQEELEFHSLVAETVFLLQDTEKAIQLCEKTVFAHKFDFAELYKEDKRTLGNLVCALKAKAEIQNDFEKTLNALIDNRNILIHRAISRPWWKAIREKNFVPASQFLGELLHQTCKVKLVFESLVVRYARGKTFGDVDKELEEYRRTGYLEALEAVSGYAQKAIKSRGHEEKTASSKARRNRDGK